MHPAVAILLKAADRGPHGPAIRGPQGVLTAAEVLGRVDQQVEAWASSGMTPGDVVLVVASRSVDLPIAMLAAWRAGAVAAISDEQPPERLDRVAREVGARWVVDVVSGTLTKRPDPGRLPAVAGASHVLFTSGTTGLPAGVIVGPESFEAALNWYLETFSPSADDRIAMLSGLGHDPLLRDIFVPLSVGAELVVPDASVTRDPRAVLRTLVDNAITIWHTTPSMVEFVLGAGTDPAALAALRLVVLGGEAPTRNSVDLLRALTTARLVNAYGTTETPQIIAMSEIIGSEPELRTVGRGVGGAQLLLGSELSSSFREVSGCGEDEIVVRSQHLAWGYVRPQGGTRFFDDPLGHEGWRSYLTGDRGDLTDDGLLKVVGRRDREINLNGHRIHPAEIEAAARDIEGVHAARCRLEESDAGPLLSLTVLVEAGTPVRARDLRVRLRLVLPTWAVPTRVQIADSGQLTLNHKKVV